MSTTIKQPQIAVYCCDQCGEESDRPFAISISGRWYSDDLDEDFCSALCLSEWSHTHASIYGGEGGHISIRISVDGGHAVRELMDMLAGHR